MANAKNFTLDDKMGHMLVQILLLINNGQKATQVQIKKQLKDRSDAPTLTNLDHPLRYLLSRKDPGKTRQRPQTKKPWLAAHGRDINFVNPEKVLSDYRACAGLLFAIGSSSYKDSYYSFSIKHLAEFLKNSFQVDSKLMKLILEDFRKCEYTMKSSIDSLEEQIFPAVVNPEIFYLKIAAENRTLVKDYSNANAGIRN